MSEIQVITKESIYNALKLIDDEPNRIKGRESIEYDLLNQGKKYPPILVLSEANKLLGGNSLTISDFGESAKKAFSILEKFGFTIEKKYPMLDKQIVIDIANLCEAIAVGKENGSITDKTYSNIFKPRQDEFKIKYKKTPNLLLQNQLQFFLMHILRMK